MGGGREGARGIAGAGAGAAGCSPHRIARTTLKRTDEPRAEGQPADRLEVEVSESEAGTRLDSLVSLRTGLSRTQAATLIANGCVLVAGKKERAAYRPRPGERISVEIPPPRKRVLHPEEIPLTIAFEDEHVIVVDKPAGMVVHPAPGNWSGTLVNALLGRGGELSGAGGELRAGIVHRLDKETSGLLLVAKSEKVHRALSAALAARRIVRRYAVLCWGHLTRDSISVEKAVGRDPRDRKRMAVVSTGRPARTDFRRLARFDSTDLLRASLHSGRTHQIRVHLASIGHPVVGDDVYGGGGGRRLVGLPPRRHFLHAAWLRFRHPVTGEVLDLRSPLPPDLARALEMAAGRDHLFADADGLDYFGFFQEEN